MSSYLNFLVWYLFTVINISGYAIESPEFEESFQENYSRLEPFIAKLKEQHYSSSETSADTTERKSVETTFRTDPLNKSTFNNPSYQIRRKSPLEFEENSLKQLIDIVSNTSKQLVELEKFVKQVLQYQIIVEEQLDTKYPNFGTMPDKLQAILEGPFVQLTEQTTKLLTDLNRFESLLWSSSSSSNQLNPFIIFGNDLELFLEKMVELYNLLKMNAFAILENSQRIGPEKVVTEDHKCVFCEQRVSIMNMINLLRVFSHVLNQLEILYSTEIKESDSASGEFDIKRTKDI